MWLKSKDTEKLTFLRHIFHRIWMCNYDLNFMLYLFVYWFIFKESKKETEICSLKLVGSGSSSYITSERREDYFLFLSNLSSLFITVPEKKTRKKQEKTRS